jgi:hypothetical protein
MAKGTVRVHGKIDATLGPGKLTLVQAWIRGTEHPEQEVLIIGHLDHPKWSANDNASGSGAMMEAARTLNALIASKKILAPRITIHFMWVPEYFGTLAYVTNHHEVRRCEVIASGAAAKKGIAATQTCVLANINMDMVGEDTIKTNSRFYFTKTPDSVASFLDGMLTDVLAQTREANLYAPTGTRNYWLPESIPYAQGSDHDVFLGLGIPATMFGHDPDWTHHSSEDKIDKTDASEFRRAGVFAAASGYWMAAAGPAEWLKLDEIDLPIRVSNLTQRIAAEKLAGSAPRVVRRTAEELSGPLCALRGNLAASPRAMHICDDFRKETGGPQKSTLLPLDASVWKNASPEDASWLAEQEARFASDSEGLATKPNFGLISFEAINFMDGHRSTAEIAELLSAEYLIDIDQAWVDRLVSILEKQKLAAR